MVLDQRLQPLVRWSGAPPKITITNANGAGDAMAAAFFSLCLDNALGPAGTATMPLEILEDMLVDSLVAGANFAAGNGV